MSFSQILYQLLIYPLELVIEIVYCFSFIVLQNYGTAIIPLSLTITLLLLPFYKRADAISREEADLQKKMEYRVKRIKQTFHGNERFFMLQEYYRVNDYKPVYSLKSSVSLLLQIPFFIAAYHFLSRVQCLQGVSFGFISDLGNEDGTFKIGNFPVNVLPILMTLINVVSSEIYAKGKKLSERLRLHLMALVFLILLYHSPSGLVLYWTLNNVFSLIKNLISKCKKPELARSIAYGMIGVVILTYALVFYNGLSMYRAILLALSLPFLVPLLKMLPQKEIGGKKNTFEEAKNVEEPQKEPRVTAPDARIFLMGAVFLSLLTGFLIPSEVIRSSPGEFVLYSAYRSPIWHIVSACLLSFGTFVIWVGLLYYLGSKKIRNCIIISTLLFSIVGSMNYFAFGKGLGMLTSDLHYSLLSVKIPVGKIALNLGLVIAVSLLLYAAYKWKQKLFSFILPALIISVLGMGIFNVADIAGKLPKIKEVLFHQQKEDPSFTLSREGKNVVVIMMDRGLSRYVPYMFGEKPELKDQFSGFTWYPNTLSYGASTNTGSPGLYGGYEYTPLELNKRDSEKMVEKHNEALKVMPVIFSENGFDTTVCDPPWANYSTVPDLSIYDDHPQIHTFLTESGQFLEEGSGQADKEKIWKRNFFCYSVMKMVPLFFQDLAYQDGTYFSNDSLVFTQRLISTSESVGYDGDFLSSYAALSAFSQMTKIADDDSENFLLIHNSTPHNIALLSEPEYEPALIVDNTEYDSTHTGRLSYNGVELELDSAYRMAHYQSNMCAMIKLGEWLDKLRDEGVYDNTRIIIVSDHGYSLGQFEDMRFGGEWYDETSFNPEDAMVYNALLFVKDFGENGDFKADNTFMTNADTPSLAMEGLIGEPVNPFTGKRLDDTAEKDADTHYVFYSDQWEAPLNNGYTFSSGMWCSLKGDDIFDKEKWQECENP